ncbi:MAG: hypothetical protein J6K94_04655 [Ruminiclostridium sp.]|nr:hypothetical protein [Ruminiclostridium sp.]
MKRVLPLLLCLFLLGGCTFSSDNGGGLQAMPLEEYQELLRTEPLATLAHDTWVLCGEKTQVVGLETQEDGILFRVTETMTDGQSLYVAFELTFPEPVNVSSKDVLAYGLFNSTLNVGITTPGTPVTGPQFHSGPSSCNQYLGDTIVGYITFKEVGTSLDGQDVTLVIHDLYGHDDTPLRVSWKMEPSD